MDMVAEVHRSVVDVLVAHAAPHCASFGELLGHLPGVYPAEAVASLNRLGALRLVDPAAWARLDPAAQPICGPDEDGRDQILPQPHPLDYDWRFGQFTAELLQKRCVQLTKPGETIALLGTPTLLMAASGNIRGRRWVLLEASAGTVGFLNQTAPGDVLRCDLAHDELPDLTAQVAVADPPWYLAHARIFLWAATRLTAPGATVLLAQPAVATRPGVLAERAELFAWADAAGLTVTAIRTGTLSYTCPSFERRALAAAGLTRVPSRWRRGDLIEFRRTPQPDTGRPELDQIEQWQEIMISGSRIRFRTDMPCPAGISLDPQLVRLVEGDVLTSVSRRDPLRSRVRVWSASNRVFACQAPQLLACIAAALDAGQPVIAAASEHLGRRPGAHEARAIRGAARQLQLLVQAEIRDEPSAPAEVGSIGALVQVEARAGDPVLSPATPVNAVYR
jgi:hypothetical protein